MRFSANLGFLWQDRSLPDAIHAAREAGFDAVECHFPYVTPAAKVAQALRETGLRMLGLNTRPGDAAAGDFGLCALPDRVQEGRDAIAQALDYAAATGTGAVHVMAGRSDDPRAPDVFAEALHHACDLAEPLGITVLIEPLNPRDVPGYALIGLERALALRARVDRPGLKIMFDCYHQQLTGGDLVNRFRAALPHVGHVQFAGVPDRGRPDRGEVDYAWLLPELARAGWSGPFGAEYRPGGDTEASLDWLSRWRGA